MKPAFLGDKAKIVFKDFSPEKTETTEYQGRKYKPHPDQFILYLLCGKKDETKKDFFASRPDIVSCNVTLQDFAKVEDGMEVEIVLSDFNGSKSIEAIKGMTVINEKQEQKKNRLEALLQQAGISGGEQQIKKGV